MMVDDSCDVTGTASMCDSLLVCVFFSNSISNYW